jgi:2-C-methyl-D-erythritol 4-phosphate cytidylyltransferase
VTETILRENVKRAIEAGAVDTCIPSTDTLVYAPGGERIAGIPKREEYLRGQTPQTFNYEWIVEAHERARQEGVCNATDDCGLVLRLGRPIYVVKGDEKNMKITTELDLLIAEQIALSKKVSC